MASYYDMGYICGRDVISSLVIFVHCGWRGGHLIRTSLPREVDAVITLAVEMVCLKCCFHFEIIGAIVDAITGLNLYCHSFYLSETICLTRSASDTEKGVNLVM